MEQQYSPQKFSFLPPVIKNLLIINTLVYLSSFFFKGAFGIDINDILGLRYPLSSAFRPFQFLTYMFAHASFSHLFFNMFALWMFGYAVENVMGSKRFLIFYLVCGVGAALCHYGVAYFSLEPVVSSINYIIANPSYENILEFVRNHRFYVTSNMVLNGVSLSDFNSSLSVLQFNSSDYGAMQTSLNFLAGYKEFYMNLPNVVGASGAVFAILLAFGMLFPNVYIYLYFFVPIKAKWFVIFYGIIELMFWVFGAGGNIAHFAHLGGMIFGLIFILIWRKKGILPRSR